MTTQHTPAPWRVSVIYGKYEVFSFADGQVIARMGKKAGKANAKLIASAPELLEALIDLLSFHNAEAVFHPLMMISIDNARAAIAKATQ